MVRGLGIKRGIQGVFGRCRTDCVCIRQSARPSDGAERSVKIVLKVVTTENYSGVGQPR